MIYNVFKKSPMISHKKKNNFESVKKIREKGRNRIHPTHPCGYYPKSWNVKNYEYKRPVIGIYGKPIIKWDLDGTKWIKYEYRTVYYTYTEGRPPRILANHHCRFAYEKE